jgi:hypothetical protein
LQLRALNVGVGDPLVCRFHPETKPCPNTKPTLCLNCGSAMKTTSQITAYIIW